MSELQRASRESLFGSREPESDDNQAPGYTFEFTEIEPDLPITNVESDNEELSFNLFGQTTAVTIADSTEEDEKWIQGHNKRPESWYLYKPVGEEHRNIVSIAVSGQQVLDQSTQTWPGMEMLWRVSDLKEMQQRQQKEANQLKKRRPGKKSRLRHLELMKAKLEARKSSRSFRGSSRSVQPRFRDGAGQAR